MNQKGKEAFQIMIFQLKRVIKGIAIVLIIIINLDQQHTTSEIIS
jgi:hypothetical protein